MSLGDCAPRPNLAWPATGFWRNSESLADGEGVQSEDTSREVAGWCSEVWQAALCHNFGECDCRVSGNQRQPTEVHQATVRNCPSRAWSTRAWTWSRGRSRVGHVSPRKCVCGVWREANSFSTSWSASETPTSEMWPPQSLDHNPLDYNIWSVL